MKEPQKIMENLVLVMLGISIWDGRKQVQDCDIKLGQGGELLPKDLADLGRKKVIHEKALAPFSNIRNNVRTEILKIGQSFGKLYAVPRSRLAEILNMLEDARIRFDEQVPVFISEYWQFVQDKVDQHPNLEDVIRSSAPDPAHAASRMVFDYDLIELNPTEGPTAKNIENKVLSLGDELLEEVIEESRIFLNKRIFGQDQVSIKTRPTLEALRRKVEGLVFLNPNLNTTLKLLDNCLRAYQVPQAKHLKGPYFYQLQACLMVLADRELMKRYITGSITVDDLRDQYLAQSRAQNAQLEIEEVPSPDLYVEPASEPFDEIECLSF